MTEGEKFSLVFDYNEVTLGEMEEIENYMQVPYDEVFPTSDGDEPKKLNAKQTMCLAFIAGRRQNPEFTWDDARAVKVRQLRQDEAPKADTPPESDG